MGMGARGVRRSSTCGKRVVRDEGQKWDGGFVGAEKIVAASIYEFSQITTVPPKPKTPTGK